MRKRFESEHSRLLESLHAKSAMSRLLMGPTIDIGAHRFVINSSNFDISAKNPSSEQRLVSLIKERRAH